MVATAPVTHGTHTILHARKVATIAGVPTDVLSYDVSTHVNQPIATGSVTLPLPLPDHLRGEDGNVLNQPIHIQAGYTESSLRTRFNGRIDADRMEINERERTATLHMRGWATLLDWEEEDDLVFSGPIALHEIVRSLCAWRGVPAYSVIDVNTHQGGPALLGGNPYVDEGNVIIPRRTSPLAWIDRKLRLYGYRIFDTPSGELRVRRISGEPIGASSATYTEGVNCYRIERTRDLKPMKTNWTIEGATYIDDDGVSIPVRSFPASVPADPLLTPPGYRSGRLTDNDIVTIPRAHTIRYVQEIDHARPYHELRWETWADQDRQPGEAVTLDVPTFDAAGRYWLMGITERFDDGGFVDTMSAWVGGTTSFPSGDDLEEVNVGAGPWHVGDEYLSHYAVPSPQGTTITIPVTIPSDVTSIAIRGYGHGMNSYLIDGANTEATVSKIEVWQGGGERPVGSAELPVMPENLLQRLNYKDGLKHWTAFRMPVPGRLEAGSAEIRLVAGEDSRASLAPVDDFEARDIVLELRGHGRPALPRKRNP